jgi:dTDP-4-amino-4,6-dideoxygalactose transaminase
MSILFMGGEYFYSPGIFFSGKKYSLETDLTNKFPSMFFSYFAGGNYSITRILQHLALKDQDTVLLPSYLCPSILLPFKKAGINFRFYKIDEKLEIDLTDLKNKIDAKSKAVYFINYFGFPQKQEVRTFLKELKTNNIVIIEDAAQSFFSQFEPTGNFIFSSFRKFLPVDGSILISHVNMDKAITHTNFAYLFYRSLGQWFRYIHYTHHISSTKQFLSLFEKANKNYYKDYLAGFDFLNRFILSRIPIDQICEKRRENFSQLLETLHSCALIKNLDRDIVPLGFPVLVKNRDQIRKFLQNDNIFCPVHWRLPEEVGEQEFPESHFISSRILTIPINEKVGSNEMNRFFENWEKIKCLY